MKRFLLVVCAVFLIGLLAPPAFADNGIQVDNESLDINFPHNMTFSLAATAPADITKAELVVRFPGVTQRLKPDFTPNQQLKTSVIWDLADSFANKGGYMPPGVSGTYTWVIEDAAGNKTETPPQTFFLADERFPFQVAEDDALAIHWYGASKEVGQRVFDTARNFLGTLRQELGVGAQDRTQIWLYNELQDFRSATPSERDWTGGSSYFNYRVILLADSPEDEDALAGIRHELTHQTLSDIFGGGLGESSLPLWMNEGFAVYNGEANRQRPPIYFQNALNDAVAVDQLPTLKSLASNFATDSQAAYLSYAMSYSVVRFMIDEFGMDKFKQVLGEFKNGMATDEGLEKVYGVNTLGLENLWRKSLGLQERDASQAGFATPQAQPTFALSSAETPAPQGQATATPQSISKVETAAPVSATTVPQNTNASNSGGATTGLCGGLGGVVLAMFGVYGWRKRRKPTQL